jgi:hypothetical protein
LKKLIWLIALGVQAFVVLAFSYGAYQLLWVNPKLYEVSGWALIPAFGALSAYVATRRGLSNYVAWLVPPIAAAFGHMLAFFYPPRSAGPVFLCALLSIVGAAAGEVTKRRQGEQRRNG